MDGYVLLEAIGRGSFGTVNKVRRKSDGKILVCKTMSYGGMSEREKQLIVSEVNILRELNHPHIVRYYDRVIDKKTAKIYIMMEFCEGGDLGKQIKRRKRDRNHFEEARIWKLLAQLLKAFEVCHSHREGSKAKPILHRDVKPGNIFIDSSGNAKLGDFGLAKELPGESRFAYTNVGTPYYMPPEMVNEAKYNEKVDIWSIGCLIYEMAALRPPFEAKNVVALGKKINAGVFQRVPSFYSDELQRTISQMLQLNSRHRPSVFELLKLPTVRRYLGEAKLADKEVQLNHRFQQMYQELKAREEDLKRREQAVAIREKQLQQREEEVLKRSTELRARERSFQSISPYDKSYARPVSHHSDDFSPKSRTSSHSSSSSSTVASSSTTRVSATTPTSSSSNHRATPTSAPSSSSSLNHRPTPSSSSSTSSGRTTSPTPSTTNRTTPTTTGNTKTRRSSLGNNSDRPPSAARTSTAITTTTTTTRATSSRVPNGSSLRPSITRSSSVTRQPLGTTRVSSTANPTATLRYKAVPSSYDAHDKVPRRSSLSKPGLGLKGETAGDADTYRSNLARANTSSTSTTDYLRLKENKYRMPLGIASGHLTSGDSNFIRRPSSMGGNSNNENNKALGNHRDVYSRFNMRIPTKRATTYSK